MELIVPASFVLPVASATVHVTAVFVSPLTVAVNCCEAPMVTEGLVGFNTIFGPCDTVTVAVPDFVVSSTEVAVTVTLPAADGVNSPAVLMVPAVEGVTDHVTALLYDPVPVTVAVA